jgi:hypothetical protein
MHRTALVVAFALVGAFLAGRLSQAEDAPAKTVAAKRYKIVWAESALDLSHDGGEWIQEVFLPDAKVAADLVFEDRPFDEIKVGMPEGEFRRPRLHAFPADKPRNDLVGLHGGKPSEIEDIQVPADVAQQIIDLAALTRRLQDDGLRLGTVVEQRLGMKRVE